MDLKNRFWIQQKKQNFSLMDFGSQLNLIWTTRIVERGQKSLNFGLGICNKMALKLVFPGVKLFATRPEWNTFNSDIKSSEI
jgi:hypothetical protein